MKRRGFFGALIGIAAGAVVAPVATLRGMTTDPRAINPHGLMPWRNYTATYSTISKRELVRRMKKASRRLAPWRRLRDKRLKESWAEMWPRTHWQPRELANIGIPYWMVSNKGDPNAKT